MTPDGQSIWLGTKLFGMWRSTNGGVNWSSSTCDGNSTGNADFIVVFAEQADLPPAYNMSWEERGWFVYDTLTEVAGRSQARAQEYLKDRGLAFESYFAGNEIAVWSGDLLAVNYLAALPEVAYIRSPRTLYVDPIIDASVSHLPAGLEGAGRTL